MFEHLGLYKKVLTEVLMGNDSPCKIAGISKVIIKMFDGIALGDVKHGLDLKGNLISLGALDSKEYKYAGEGTTLTVSKSSLIVMKG